MSIVLFLLLASGNANETPFTHKSYDGFKIDAKLAVPKGMKESDVTRVVVLVGGSGAYDMDLDLTVVSKDKSKKNLWLRDISDALVRKGFAVIRYNKRTYQFGVWGRAIRSQGRKPTAEENAVVIRFRKNPLKAYVDDCKSFVEGAAKRFPKAKVYVLGGSEGTHVALWAAHETKSISGVSLVGFYAESLEVVLYEQAVHRELSYFRSLDKNHDGVMTKEEMQKGGRVGFGIMIQTKKYDRNKDGDISLAEFKAMTLTQHLRNEIAYNAYRRQEAKYPSMLEVLKGMKIPVAFFQGEWDNQTPAFNAMAIQYIAKDKWKKDNLHFYFFPKLGHCLDPRDDYFDKLYRVVDPAALKKMVDEMDKLFR